ncbi:homoaconitate hydratase family protein [Pleurocapsa sp. CCALA 161]|uniref:aconitase/3-isopropylmalate dehydratase large subunit family protein n=1 Tax=Pleurocapsa sp. CCALA 161 TaxID=2107688 RepID=UPI000D055294|nr:aconitase/3-isopropylmalate dehydratase large subunit family protein [Pleurocapsa sp. CCALA 161]PSB05894.1 homoaconitate hydratase family protein [Pleurocapsa sp. CCALA 161]
MKIKVLKLGDDINTDDIIPAHRSTNPDPEHQKHYVLEHLIGVDTLLQYEVIEAGENFGCGSSREYAPIAIKTAGIKLVRARSFAEIFYRNSINIGLAVEIIGESQDNPVVQAISAAGGLTAFNQQRLQSKIAVPHSNTPSRSMTMAEKMLARASGNDYVQPGEVVFAKVDLAMSHDAIAAPVFELFRTNFGEYAQIWDASKVVLVADHFIQVNDIRIDSQATKLYQNMVDFAHHYGCRLFDLVSPGEASGICHVLLPEQGLIHPGMIIAGTDSHSCTYGAFGSFSTGVGTTDMANILATGDMWLRVPGTIVFVLGGRLPQDLSAKDIMLFILGKIGCQGAMGKVLEFRGSIIEQLSIDERMTLSNMAVECGAMCGLIVPDAVTAEYLQNKNVNVSDYTPIVGDQDAIYDSVYQFDLSNLEAQIACPPKPDNVVNLSELPDIPITLAFIGSCTGGKLTDLAQAAAILKDRQVNPQVQMYVVPASQLIRQQAEALGYLEIFAQAGVQILKSGCGACINSGKGVLGKQETGIYATNRNFTGRTGDPTSKNYLASPRVVSISAVNGKISDRL